MKSTKRRTRFSHASKRVRYAVVGLGHIAQVAVLPAFAHAGNSELAALVSDDPVKRRKIGDKYKVERRFAYDQFDECLASGEIDAVYIALPNSMHRDNSVRAAEAGVHVLCEKPMATNEDDCEAMIRAAEDHDVKLMIAYRLHFERANLKAVELVQSGALGEPRIFNSVFSMQVKDDNIRLEQELGGGPVWDLGIYCINAARYLFRAEPIEIAAFTACGDDHRFQEVEEMASAVLKFPEDRLATFTCSFGASDVSHYQVVGTKGDLLVCPAYEYAEGLKHYLTIDGKTTEQTFPKRDQFAPELVHFSDCVLTNKNPEPSGIEGLADVRIIEALYRSANTGLPVELGEIEPDDYPSLKHAMHRPAVKKPKLVHAESAHEE
jgi:glucose-fructose oxidoreductase